MDVVPLALVSTKPSTCSMRSPLFTVIDEEPAVVQDVSEVIGPEPAVQLMTSPGAGVGVAVRSMKAPLTNSSAKPADDPMEVIGMVALPLR